MRKCEPQCINILEWMLASSIPYVDGACIMYMAAFFSLCMNAAQTFTCWIYIFDTGVWHTVLNYSIDYFTFRYFIQIFFIQLLYFVYYLTFSYYPLFPPAADVNMDVEHFDTYGRLNVTPHLLILPSDLRHFIKVTNSQSNKLFELYVMNNLRN